MGEPIEAANCAECPFAKDGKPKRPVLGAGSSDPKFIVVGDSPAKWEEVRKMPLAGTSGKVVTGALKKLGLTRDDIWIDNAAACRPKPGSSPAKRSLAAKCCRPRLDAQLAQFPGKPILAMGATAAKELLADDKLKISKYTGTWAHVDGRDVIVTMHPAAFMRANGTKASGAHAPDLQYWGFLFDLAKVGDIANGEESRFGEDIELARDRKSAQYLLEKFTRHVRRQKGHRTFALDLETAGVDGHSALEQAFTRITTIGLATETRGISIPWRCMGHKARETLRRLLADPSLHCVFHNRVYDEPVLNWHGFDVANQKQCTMLMHHAAFPGLSHNLQRVTSQFYLVPPWKTSFRESDEQYETELLEYNALDTLATARIVPKLALFMGDVNKVGSPGHIYAHDNAKAFTASQMQQRGIPINLDTNEKLSDIHLPKIEAQRDRMRDFWKNEEFREEFIERLCMEQAKKKRKADSKDYLERVEQRKVDLHKKIAKGKFELLMGSPNHVAAYLQCQGVRLSTTTKAGAISTNKEILEQFIDHDCVRDLLVYRSSDKAYGTFIKKIPHVVRWDPEWQTWRLHVSWSVNKITGRWGSSNPMNAQNWPLDMREQVEAPPGCVIIGADFAQVDARAIALLSKDPFLLGIFERGDDLHAICATAVFPEFPDLEPKSEKWTTLRTLIKRVEYGAFYGGTPPTLFASVRKEGFDVTMNQIGKMLDLLSTKMGRVRVWQNGLVKQAMRKGYIEDGILGRRRHFPLGNVDMNVIYNFPAQATAAVVMDLGLQRLMGNLDLTQAHPILQVHDAAYVESRESYAPECVGVLESSLHQTFTIDGVTVEFPAEAKQGTIWKEVS